MISLTLLDKLNEDMKQAMRDKEKEKLSVIRMLKAALQNEAIHQGVKDLTPDDEVTVISRELKQRRDSLAEFDKAGRNDLSDKVRSEIVIVEDYAPKQLTPEELENIVKATIEEVGASSKADFGKVMSAIMPKVKGKADGGAVNQFVKNIFHKLIQTSFETLRNRITSYFVEEILFFYADFYLNCVVAIASFFKQGNFVYNITNQGTYNR